MGNIEYCGVVILLRHLLKEELLTHEEAVEIAERAAAELGATMVLFL